MPCSKITLPGSHPGVKFEVTLGVLADGTVAVEVVLCNALLQWAYFQDLSMVRGGEGPCGEVNGWMCREGVMGGIWIRFSAS
jgi:hypothetical protein